MRNWCQTVISRLMKRALMINTVNAYNLTPKPRLSGFYKTRTSFDIQNSG